jgi:hypothetical protein
MQVLDHRIQVKALEFLSVIELLAHGIWQGGVLVQDPQVQLVRPQVRIRRGPSRRVSGSAVHYRAFAFG